MESKVEPEHLFDTVHLLNSLHQYWSHVIWIWLAISLQDVRDVLNCSRCTVLYVRTPSVLLRPVTLIIICSGTLFWNSCIIPTDAQREQLVLFPLTPAASHTLFMMEFRWLCPMGDVENHLSCLGWGFVSGLKKKQLLGTSSGRLLVYTL